MKTLPKIELDSDLQIFMEGAKQAYQKNLSKAIKKGIRYAKARRLNGKRK